MGADDAIGAIEERAAAARPGARQRWAEAATGAGPVEDWGAVLWRAGRLTLNFHPDRMTRHGRTVSAGLATAGVYRSQWITGISAGSRSATPGGERQRFERELFGGAYDETEPGSGTHPVYGSFDLLFDEHGGSPRFGSAFVVLASHVRERTTLCLGDSHQGPSDVGTFDQPWALLAGLAEQASRNELLNRGLGWDALVAALRRDDRPGCASRDLDGYVEAQVHGGVSLADDVEAIIVDPSFRGTAVEDDLSVAAARFGFELGWHVGSELPVEDVPDDFRGPGMPALAGRIADATGVVHARAIGAAASREQFEEPTVSGDPPDSPRQQLKYLWHSVVAYGRDAGAR